LLEQDGPQEAEHQPNRLDRLGQSFYLFLRQRPAGLEILEPLNECRHVPGQARPTQYFAHMRFHKSPRHNHPQEVPVVPHIADFPVDEMKNLFFERRSERQLVGQLHYFLRNPLLNERQQEAFLAPEITMDETFGAARTSCDLGGPSGFVSAVREQFGSRYDQRFLLACRIPQFGRW
jgi:hypothetical protein